MILITHILGGASAVALLDTVVTSYHPSKFAYIVGALVATLPDLDYSRSFIGRLFYPISRSLESITGHRTMTHSFLFALLVSIFIGFPLAYFQDQSLLQWFIVVFVSYCSHIVLDWFTIEGCASYWPAKVWCVMPARRSWRVRTGRASEFLFFCFLAGAFMVMFTPSRLAAMTWFRSSFVQPKDEEMQRFTLRKEEATHGHTIEELDTLYQNGVISKKELEAMTYEVKRIELNETVQRKMYGMPTE